MIGGLNMGLFGSKKSNKEEAHKRNLERFGKLNSRNKEVLDMYYEEGQDEYECNYRKRGLEDAASNNGWYTCVKCGRKFRKGDMDIDHIIPRSLGGDNSRYNLQCICKHCNRSKGADTSETKADLARRKRELDRQRKEDEKFLNEILKYQKIKF